MRSRKTLLATGFAIAAVTALMVGPTLGAQAAGGKVYFTSKCVNAKIEPKTIILGCADFGFYVNKLVDWHGWGGKQPHAKGQAHVNNCDPSCEQGNFHKFRGNIRLSKIAKCPQDGLKHYKRALFTFPARRPNGYPQHIYQKFPCTMLNS